MPEVATTKADLLSRFADSPVGGIKAEDSRALINSVLGSFGAMAISAGQAPTTVGLVPAAIGTFDQAGASLGVTLDLPGGTVSPDVGGVWELIATLYAAVQTNRRYKVRAVVNGSPAGPAAYGEEKTGGETNGVACFVLAGLGTVVAAGATIGLEVSADQAGSGWQVLSATITLKRIA